MTAADTGFEAATLEHLQAVAERLRGPRIKALHLPLARPTDPLAGESCAIELDDGSIGLSYVLFGTTFEGLGERGLGLPGAEAAVVAQGLVRPPRDEQGLPRTLGLAAANALTASLWRRAEWAPPSAADSMAGLDPRPGEAVGMVGWFGPLVPRVRERGANLVVVELRADLCGWREGVLVTDDQSALAECTQVLATGTVLLNGTLGTLLHEARNARRFVLVGPSAGLLPDDLFARGVTAIGGSWIEDRMAFVAALESGAPRSTSARKFVLDAATYPGLSALLARC